MAEHRPGRLRSASGHKLRIHGSIAHELGMDIVSGRYLPGQHLAKEVIASRRLKVSRTAYREAIRILAAKGLVESQPKTGTRISERARWHLLDPDVLQWIFSGEADDRMIQGLFELRMVVEPAAAAFAASRRNESQLTAMKAALYEMRAYGLTVERGQLADCEFHRTLLAATDNDVLAALASGITAAVRWTTVYKTRANPLPRDPIEDHARVFDAIAGGDAEQARIAMTELLQAALEDTRRPAAQSARRKSASKSASGPKSKIKKRRATYA